MEELDDMELLRRYAADGSEAAFETLVSRRIRFVYSAALRQMLDPHLAEEVTQAVFIILAQKAGRMNEKSNVTGWLFKTTRFVALSQMRAVVRRHQYEKEAQLETESQSTAPDPVWQQLSPLLDGALAQLGEKDRQALLLRFFEDKSMAQVGALLGSREDTARMRVNRALEKLRRYFLKRGVVSTTAVIATVIAAHSAQAEPAMLAKSVATAALAKGATASVSTLTLIKGALKIMAWTKAKTVIVVGVSILIAGGATTVGVKKYQAHLAYIAAIKSWRFPILTTAIVSKAVPQTAILPTKFKPPVYGFAWAPPNRWAGVAVKIDDIAHTAYQWPPGRITFPGGEPTNRYDFASTLLLGSGEALQNEIKETLGYAGHKATIDTDVLVLRVRNPGLLKVYTDGPQKGLWDIRGHIWAIGGPIALLNRYLEMAVRIPVVNETGLEGRYSIEFTWNETGDQDPTHEALKQAVLDHTGLELVPATRPVEMLVMEKVK